MGPLTHAEAHNVCVREKRDAERLNDGAQNEETFNQRHTSHDLAAYMTPPLTTLTCWMKNATWREFFTKLSSMELFKKCLCDGAYSRTGTFILKRSRSREKLGCGRSTCRLPRWWSLQNDVALSRCSDAAVRGRCPKIKTHSGKWIYLHWQFHWSTSQGASSAPLHINLKKVYQWTTSYTNIHSSTVFVAES